MQNAQMENLTKKVLHKLSFEGIFVLMRINKGLSVQFWKLKCVEFATDVALKQK